MPIGLPTVIKTWQRSYNLSNTPSGNLETDNDNVLLLLIAALVGFGSSPYTVRGSSNSSVAALDGANRWVTPSNLVHAAPGSAHSWITLRNPVTGWEICIDLATTTVTNMTVVWAAAGGFTGGTTTARPTATNEKVILSNAVWAGFIGASGGQYRLHVMHASDGSCTRWYVNHSGVPAGAYFFESLRDPSPGWSLPYAAAMRSANTTEGTNLDIGNWNGAGKWSAHGPVADMPMGATQEYYAPAIAWIGSRIDAANEISGLRPISPQGLWHDTTVGQRGRHGILFDFWWTNPSAVTGDTFPSDGSHVLQLLGDHLVATGGQFMLVS